MDNTLISINWCISKSDGSEISDKEHENLTDSLLLEIEKLGFMAGGGSGLFSEKEYLEELHKN